MNDSLPAKPERKSLLVSMARKYQMDPDVFRQTIKATVMPSNASTEQMAAFLLVANQYDLNPITREIYAFPDKRGGITPVVGIDGWISLAQRRQELDGLDFTYEHDMNGDLVSCTAILYRKDRSKPVRVTEYMAECRRATDPWKSHPRRMLRHKAAIQAIRYSFGFSGLRDEDEIDAIQNHPAATVITAEAASISSAIDEINAGIAETKAAQEARWPKKTDAGWVDSAGELYDETRHGWNAKEECPSVKADGTFRSRRGGVKTRTAPEIKNEARTAPEIEDEEDSHSNVSETTSHTDHSALIAFENEIESCKSIKELDALWSKHYDRIPEYDQLIAHEELELRRGELRHPSE